MKRFERFQKSRWENFYLENPEKRNYLAQNLFIWVHLRNEKKPPGQASKVGRPSMELPGICFLIRGAQATHTHPPPFCSSPCSQTRTKSTVKCFTIKHGQNPQLNGSQLNSDKSIVKHRQNPRLNDFTVKLEQNQQLK